MQSQRPEYVPSSLSLYAKKRSAGLITTQLSAVEEGIDQSCGSLNVADPEAPPSAQRLLKLRQVSCSQSLYRPGCHKL